VKHYVYIYFDRKRVPYYIGVGIKSRYLNEHRVPHPHYILLLHENEDREPLNRQSSLTLERHLVTSIGRQDLGNGPLLNLTDGGSGCLNLTGESLQKLLRGAKRGGYTAGPGNGKKAKESGQFAKMVTRESCIKGAQAINHKRWHLGRRIIDPDCFHCVV
jgi:hypothetical protein